jgi:hypothetical protein
VLSCKAETSAPPHVSREPANIKTKEDWTAPVAVEIISEIMKFAAVVSFTQLYLHISLESHIEGILTLSYHPSWSSIRNTLAYVSNFSSTARIATSPLRASVD